MKKSIFNIFRKIEEDKDIIFNSQSLAIARIDQDFFEIYNNLENINFNNLNEKEKETYKAMCECNFIVDNKADEMKNLEFFRLTAISNSKLFELLIVPTLNCNFNCSYCYEKNKKGFISKEVQEKIIDLVKFYAEKKTNINIGWYGGEPLLAFDIISDLSEKMIDICKKNNVRYFSSMISNGYLLTNSIIKKLEKYDIKTIQITLDGPPELHNKRRVLIGSKEGTFDKILENIKKLKNNNIKLDIRVNVNKECSIEKLMQLVTILKKNGLKDDFYISQEFDSNTRACLNENCLSNKAFGEFSLNFYKKLHDLGITSLAKKIYFPRYLFNFCGATKFNSLIIDPEGYQYKCYMDIGLPEEAIGNILDNKNYNEEYFNNNVKYMTWSPFNFGKCNQCNLIPICLGNCPKIGIDKNEPQCIEWKYNIENFIDAVSLCRLEEKN